MRPLPKLIFIVFVLALIGASGYYLSQLSVSETTNTATSTWKIYENKEYGFTVRYPEGWAVSEYPSDAITPRFNIHPENATGTPYTHHSDYPNVSVFPNGVPTEGVFSQSRNAASDYSAIMNPAVSRATESILEDGTPWAAYLQFEDAPSAWNEAGFVWARASVEDRETRCERDGAEISPEECEPLMGDTIIHNGTVDTEQWETEQRILESFEFSETDTGDSLSDLIRLDTPARNATITSPLTVSGEARGPWYFEAQFNVVLTDWDGRIIAEEPATADGEWMTEEFVPFEAELSFDAPNPDEAGTTEEGVRPATRGTLILQKANPSGLPENDAALEVPVRFSAE